MDLNASSMSELLETSLALILSAMETFSTRLTNLLIFLSHCFSVDQL